VKGEGGRPRGRRSCRSSSGGCQSSMIRSANACTTASCGHGFVNSNSRSADSGSRSLLNTCEEKYHKVLVIFSPLKAEGSWGHYSTCPVSSTL